MDFLKKTDMEAVRNEAIKMLHSEPVKDYRGYFHPFTDGTFMLDGSHYTLEGNPDKWEEKKAYIEKHIMETDLLGLSILFSSHYVMEFFENTISHLSKEDFSEILAVAYTQGETGRVETEDLIEWFFEADKAHLMSAEEKAKYDSLPEVVKVYRGASEPELFLRPSWTLEEKRAEWFANRSGGFVLKSKVKKEYIFACFDGREENEVILNPEALEEFSVKRVR